MHCYLEQREIIVKNCKPGDQKMQSDLLFNIFFVVQQYSQFCVALLVLWQPL